MINKPSKNLSRVRRHARVRKVVFGLPERPRLCVFRSNKHIEAQLIDDVNHVTLLSSSSTQLDLPNGNKENAKKVGEDIAKKALAKGYKQVVFDRGGYVYHGRVAALAEGARSGGLEF